MAERRPAGYPKLKNYKPSRFMLPTFYPVVYGLKDDEDWEDEANW